MAADRHDREPDPYATLGVSPTASHGEIRRAYRRLVLSHHPDRVPPSDRARAEERTKRINAAATMLLDPARRARTDARRADRGPSARAVTTERERAWPFVDAATAEPHAQPSPSPHARGGLGFVRSLRRIDGGAVVSVLAVVAFGLVVRHVTSPSAEVVRRELEPVSPSASDPSATAATALPNVRRRNAAPSSWRASRWSFERRQGWRRARESAVRRARARRRDVVRTSSTANPTTPSAPRWPVIEQAMREIGANQNGARADAVQRSSATRITCCPHAAPGGR